MQCTFSLDEVVKPIGQHELSAIDQGNTLLGLELDGVPMVLCEHLR